MEPGGTGSRFMRFLGRERGGHDPRQVGRSELGRFKMRLILVGAISAISVVAALSATRALAVQDMPTTIDGIPTVCTGVGSSKDDPRWKDYPVKIVLATTGGADLANAHVSLSKDGKEVAGLDCDAPW